MKIVAKYPQNWPHLNFALLAGDNEIDEKSIPLAAHGKLMFLSQPGRNAVGEVIPPVVTGYTPSAALVAAADQFSRKSRVKPPVATLENIGPAPVDASVVTNVVNQAAPAEGSHDNKRRDQR